MTELQHISHKHPLVFNQDTAIQSDGDHHTYCCGGCREKVSGPSFSCVDCGFYLHKKCAEAPTEIIDHPFHRRDHPLLLLLLPPPSEHREGDESCVKCRLCCKEGKGIFYHCSACEIYLDMDCALLPRDTAGNFIETLHVSHQQHPLILIRNDNNLVITSFDTCCCTSTSLPGAALYACFDCRIFFHKSCLELPTQINHPFHRKHLLMLDFDFETNSHVCNLCGKNDQQGFFYRCSSSPCWVNIHAGCAWPTPVIEHESHQHPFTLLLLRENDSFDCDACGNKGYNVSYTCSTCHIRVHKDCIPLPRYVRLNLHPHPISRCFSICIDHHDSRTWDCRICYKKVNIEHGSYYCPRPDCDFLIHVKCAEEKKSLYDIIEVENLDEFDISSDDSMDPIIRVIEEITVGDNVIAAKISHDFHEEHKHILTHSKETEDSRHHCYGCTLPISSPFYRCSQCDFFLHEACAKLRRKARLWYDKHPFTLNPNGIFKCAMCNSQSSGFHYEVDSEAGTVLCLPCATLPHFFTYQAYEPHQLFFIDLPGRCHACGRDSGIIWRCKDCDFDLDVQCAVLPRIAWHKCDEQHSLKLAFKDDSDYPLRHYCDICEKGRDPKRRFYHCEVCDSATHTKCVLGEYPFIKPGSRYRDENHPHRLTFVQKVYHYPECGICGDPCQDLALECLEHDCDYIVHWKCMDPFDNTESS